MCSVRLRRKGRREHSAPAEPERHGTREREARQRLKSGSTEPFPAASGRRPTLLGDFSPHDRRICLVARARVAALALAVGVPPARAPHRSTSASPRRPAGSPASGPRAPSSRRCSTPTSCSSTRSPRWPRCPASTRRWPCSRRAASGAPSRSGISAEEAERIALQAPQSTNLRALEVVYRYRLDDAAEVSARPRAGMVVPLRAGDQALGSLAALSRSSSARFFDGAVDALEGIAPPRRARARHRAGASPRPGSSPSSTRSPASTTAARSTTRCSARSPARAATSAGSRWSCSTSTTSSASTTPPATSPATRCSPRSAGASSRSSAPPTSRAASAATSSP